MSVVEGRPRTLGDLYGAGETGHLLQPQYGSKKVYKLLQRRHDRTNGSIDEEGIYHRDDHSWKVPVGVRYVLHRPLIHVQLVNKYPWFATWRSPKTGKRLTKRFMTLIAAVDFVATKAQYVDPHAAVVSRQRSYDIIPSLRNKLPKPWYWCPRCMTARKFFVVSPERTFSALKKYWSEEKQKYVFKEVQLRVIHCKYCGCTNQDSAFRRSNQPWEKRRFKKGVIRARRKRRARV